jgi:hypothetical protein
MEDQIKHSYKLCYKFQPVDARDYKYVEPPLNAVITTNPSKTVKAVFFFRLFFSTSFLV